jgi:hypothetical protein
MITVAFCHHDCGGADQTMALLAVAPLVTRILVVHDGHSRPVWPKCQLIRGDSLATGRVLEAVLNQVRTRYLLLITEGAVIDFGPRTLERLVDVMETTGRECFTATMTKHCLTAPAGSGP